MNMRRIALLLALAAACGSAQAQIKCWNDANGKRVCGDTPPPGARTTAIKGTSPSEAAASQAPAGSAAAKKGPQTADEREQD